MADLVITPANVHVHDDTVRLNIVQFGETMTAGDATYWKSSDNKYWKADADASLAESAAKGIVIVGAIADGYGAVAFEGPIDIGATLTVGQGYIVSANAAKVAPASDFSGYSGSFQHHMGYASASDRFELKPFATGASN